MGKRKKDSVKCFQGEEDKREEIKKITKEIWNQEEGGIGKRDWWILLWIEFESIKR